MSAPQSLPGESLRAALAQLRRNPRTYMPGTPEASRQTELETEAERRKRHRRGNH